MKTFTGTVVSLANQKTAMVEVARRWQHPLYKKFVKRTKKYACHVDSLELHLGDKVTIQECRPISKTKNFKVIELITQEE